VFLDAINAGNGTRSQVQTFLAAYHKAGAATNTTFTWLANGELDPGQVVCWVYEVQRGSWVPKSQIA
jgi:branched-chain amino acid transport system substrate-binding protein